MPTKLRFKVCFCSGEDPDFPASELNSHSPHTRGWVSPRFCEFPQEIGLQFPTAVELQQLQLLSHQSKISTRLELFIGQSPDGDNRPSYSRAKFKRLGYVSLDTNERSNYQARELKSVQLAAAGTFVKILIHKCHVNRLNIYSQVGVIAINAIGEQSASTALQGPTASQVTAQRKDISPLDDLTFDLNFDSATAKHIRELHAAKDRAVAAEDYDSAKRLKEAIDQLKEVGGRIAKLELRKKAAVQNEDYDTAKMIKAEIDKMRNGLLAQARPSAAHAQMPEDPRAPTAKSLAKPNTRDPFARAQERFGTPGGAGEGGLQISPEGAVGTPGVQQAAGSPVQPVSAHGTPAPAGSVMQSPYVGSPLQEQGGLGMGGSPSMIGGAEATYVGMQGPGVAHDERVIPTLVGEKSQQPDSELPEDESATRRKGGIDEMEGPEELSPANANDAEGLLQVLDERTVRSLYSKVWGFRDEGLVAVVENLDSLPLDKPNVYKSVIHVIRKGLNDKIPQVYYQTLKLMIKFVEVASNSPRGSDLNSAMDPFIAIMVKKLADASMQTKKSTTEAFESLASQPAVGVSSVMNPLAKQVKSQQAWKPVLNRLELMVKLISTHGTESINSDAVISFCLAAFESSSGKVRLEAAKVLAKINLTSPDKVARKTGNLRPVIQELIKQQIDSMSA